MDENNRYSDEDRVYRTRSSSQRSQGAARTRSSRSASQRSRSQASYDGEVRRRSSQQRSSQQRTRRLEPVEPAQTSASSGISGIIERVTSDKRILIAAIAAVVIIIVLIVALVSCHSNNSSTDTEDATQDQEQTQEQTDTSAEQTGEATAATGTDGAGNPLASDVVQEASGALARHRSAEERMATSTSDNETKPTEHVVYLTFDDSPSDLTPQFLDILDQYGVNGTWFVVGCTDNLDYINDIWDRGNQIAIHTQTHDFDVIYQNSDAFWNDSATICEAVNERLGFTPTLMRFPGGSANDYNRSWCKTLQAEAEARGWHYFDWNVGSGDATWPLLTADEIVNNITTESADNNSCCVLMHDSDSKTTTLEALPRIIEYYISEGYVFDVLTADSFGYHF